MKYLKTFEFFDTQEIKDEVGETDLDTLKGEYAKNITSKYYNKFIYLLRECPILRSDYFNVQFDREWEGVVHFHYEYEKDKSHWQLMLSVDMKNNKVYGAYQSQMYGFDVVTDNMLHTEEDFESLTEYINDNVVPKVLSWTKQTKEISGIDPMPYSADELKFSAGNN